MIRSKKLLTLTVAALALSATDTYAAFISFDASTPISEITDWDTNPGPPNPLQIQKFDNTGSVALIPVGATLTGVEVEFITDATFALTIVALGETGTTPPVTGNVSMQVALNLTGPGAVNINRTLGHDFTGIDIAPPAFESFGPATDNDSFSHIVSGSLSSFIGVGSLLFDASATETVTQSLTGTPSFVGHTITAGANKRVTYTYDSGTAPPAVPAPELALLLGTGLLGLGIFKLRYG